MLLTYLLLLPEDLADMKNNDNIFCQVPDL